MEDSTYHILKFISAFGLVMALMLLLGWALKRFGPGGTKPLVGAAKDRRLRVVEHLSLDTRRRLVLVRRDDVEHLLLLNQNHDLVVESHIASNDDIVENENKTKTKSRKS